MRLDAFELGDALVEQFFAAGVSRRFQRLGAQPGDLPGGLFAEDAGAGIEGGAGEEVGDT